jgi:histidine phosphotransferase ChpT
VEDRAFKVRAQGERAKLPASQVEVLEGGGALESLDARLVQPYYARAIAKAAGLKISMTMDGEDTVVVVAN